MRIISLLSGTSHKFQRYIPIIFVTCQAISNLTNDFADYYRDDTMLALTRVGIATFTLAVVLGPLYTVAEYSVVSNVISELGAQQTRNNFIMVAAFAVLGGCIAIDGIKTFQRALLPFILFGAAMAVVGLFPHKPLNADLHFNSTIHDIHGIIAGVAGTVITVGFIWQGIRNTGRQRVVCFYLAFVAVVFPVLMLNFPTFQGIIQRVMYFQILGWLWVAYPNLSVTK